MNVFFAIIGFAWASIGVNSLPMVVEMCSVADVGKYTGYYYTFSMSAQVKHGDAKQIQKKSLLENFDVDD